MNRFVSIVLIGVMVFLVGCSTKCPQAPELKVSISQTEKLPFRITGLSIVPAKKEFSLTEATHWSSPELKAIKDITAATVFGSGISNMESEKAASLKVTLREMILGREGWIGQTPSKYTATYEVYSPESGLVYMRKDYTSTKGFDLQSSYVCSSAVEGTAALRAAIEEVNTAFINDLYALRVRKNPAGGKRLHGSLGMIQAEIPINKDNIRVMMDSMGGYNPHVPTNTIVYEMTRQFYLYRATEVLTKQVQESKVFDHTPDNIYDVTLVVPRMKSYGGGLFSSKVYHLKARGDVYKNGKMVGSIPLDGARFSGKGLEAVMQQFKVEFADKLRTIEGQH